MSRANQQFIIFGFGFVLAACLTIAVIVVAVRANGQDLFHLSGSPAAAEAAAIPSKEVVVVKGDVEAGSLIDASMIALESRPLSDIPLSALFEMESAVGLYAAVGLSANMIVTESLIRTSSTVYEGVDRLCDYEIPGYLVNNLIDPGCSVDVQLVRTAGDTYTVLSRKNVQFKAENRVVLAVSYAEMDLVNRAFAEQNAGMGRIQVVKYMDASQSASTVNYVPAPIIAGLDTKPLGENPPLPVSEPPDAEVENSSGASGDAGQAGSAATSQPTIASASEGADAGTAVVPNNSMPNNSNVSAESDAGSGTASGATSGTTSATETAPAATPRAGGLR